MGAVARYITIAALLLCGARAFAKDDNAPGDSSKIAAAPVDKLAQAPKVKACCGFPLAEREGYRLTFYWLAYEHEYAAEKYDTPIYTRDGYLIGRYPSAFVFELGLEGTGVLLDGRVLNYDGKCDYGMGTCFKTLADEHPLGTGVQGRPLVPFRSIAVDPKRIPIGAPVYVPEIVGLTLPDGSRHDGCLRADDMGGAIKFGKMDFFVESMANFKFLADNLWWRLKATPHLDEPRCEYLRTGHERERGNEHADWAFLHKPKTLAGDRAALAKLNRNRAAAKAWVKRHGAGAVAVAANVRQKGGAPLARGGRSRAR